MGSTSQLHTTCIVMYVSTWLSTFLLTDLITLMRCSIQGFCFHDYERSYQSNTEEDSSLSHYINNTGTRYHSPNPNLRPQR